MKKKNCLLLYQCGSWRRGMLGWDCYCACAKIEDKHDWCQTPAWVQTGAWIVGVPPGREDDGESVTIRLAQRREPVREAPAPMGGRYQNMRTLNSKKTAFLWERIEEINWIFRKRRGEYIYLVNTYNITTKSMAYFVQHAFNLRKVQLRGKGKGYYDPWNRTSKKNLLAHPTILLANKSLPATFRKERLYERGEGRKPLQLCVSCRLEGMGGGSSRVLN